MVARRSSDPAKMTGTITKQIQALDPHFANILRLVIRQSFVLVTAGIVIGLTGAFALTRVMSSLLYGVSATDARAFFIPPPAVGDHSPFGQLSSRSPHGKSRSADRFAL